MNSQTLQGERERILHEMQEARVNLCRVLAEHPDDGCLLDIDSRMAHEAAVVIEHGHRAVAEIETRIKARIGTQMS